MAVNVSLLQYEARVKARVKSGEFANASEYVRHCIRVAEAVDARSGPVGASFATRADLERLLEEGMRSEAAPMTADRRNSIYQRAGASRA